MASPLLGAPPRARGADRCHRGWTLARALARPTDAVRLRTDFRLRSAYRQRHRRTVCDWKAVLVQNKVTLGTPQDLVRSDQPWIHEFFHGPRAAGAQRGATGVRTHSHE